MIALFYTLIISYSFKFTNNPEDFPSLYTCITALALDMHVKVYSQSEVKGETSYSFKIYHDKNV